MPSRGKDRPRKTQASGRAGAKRAEDREKAAADSPALPAAPPAPPSSHDEAEAYAALASDVRIDIMRSLSERPKTVLDLTRELGLHRLTVRHHLDLLQRERLIEPVMPKREGKAGRPAALYRTARHARLPTFPSRNFELIAEVAVSTMIDAFGQDATITQLRARGKAMGKAMIDNIAAQNQLTCWTPAAFEAHVLRGLFKSMGVATEVLRSDDGQLDYRSYGCLFLELAEKMPAPVCDGLDKGFHDGLDEALGDVRTTRRACMGHGDGYCEYALVWPRPPGRKTMETTEKTGA